MVKGALSKEPADSRHARPVAQPGISVDRHGMEKEPTIACAPPWDHIEIEAFLRANCLADGKETIVEDVIDLFRWRHGDLGWMRLPSIEERRSRRLGTVLSWLAGTGAPAASGAESVGRRRSPAVELVRGRARR
jgi:hypothetical protein